MKKFISVLVFGSLFGCAAITAPLVFDSSEYEHYLQIHQTAKFGKPSCTNPAAIRTIVIPTLTRNVDDLLVYTQFKTNTGLSYKMAGELNNMVVGMDKIYNYSANTTPSKIYCEAKLNDIQLGTARAMTAIGKEPQ
jgi:hypothetical protein